MKRLLASLLAAFLLCAGAASAQVLYGSLTGNVTDPSGAAVPNVKVDAQNVETGITRSGQTDERGVYLFTNMQAGLYKVTAAATSFRTYIETNVQVQAMKSAAWMCTCRFRRRPRQSRSPRKPWPCKPIRLTSNRR